MQYRVDSNLGNQNNKLGQVNEKLKDSLTGVLDVIRILEGDTWEGKSKEAALAMLSILHTYHLKLIEASQRNLTALTELEEKANSYMASGAIPTLWASDSPSKSFEEKVVETASKVENYVEDKANEAVEYAEEKGSQAVEYVEDKASQAVEYVEDKAEEVGSYVEEKVDQTGEYISNKASEAGAAMSDTYNNFTNYISSKL